ncbi:hypothetical protein BN946_scf184652.g61 [Trametes cinnabarina]|uniref:RNase H type-1 domain-containing protein n=1 Tax=Pycnoporus cinnabarinus TaxID=5643 RepID=A0A060S8X3_PYCCI|nr:hypothetical protein BN946_scf184652.g61 [Trametes cinnabarina]
MSLNCRKQPEVLKSVLNTTNPAEWDLLCLQEPPLSIDRLLSFRSPRWNLVLPSSAASRGEGEMIRSVIYVNNHLPSDLYTQISVPSLDIVALKLSLPSLSLSIFSVYNPPSSDSAIQPLQRALSDPLALNAPAIIVGDFNAHHPMWSGPLVPQRTARSDAESLLLLLAEFDLSLALPPGTPTYWSDSHHTASTLDLVFTSTSLANSVTSCSTDYGHGSDHCAINILLDLDIPRSGPAPRSQWRKTDWEEYVKAVDARWFTEDVEARSSQLTSPGDVDQLVQCITDIFNQAALDHVPKTTPSAYSKPWWTPELTKLLKEHKRTKNRADKPSASPEEQAAAKEARQAYHREIRAQQRRHWREWLNNAEEKDVYRASKYVTQAPEDTIAARLPALNLPDGRVARTCEEKRDALMAQFFPAPPLADLSDIAMAEHPSPHDHSPFTEDEVQDALADLSPFKAPGPSGIPNAALIHCADIIRGTYANILNACIQLHYHPPAWKKFTTITLRKPGKPSYLVPKAYRPIALEDTSSKVLESVVARRLAGLAEMHGLLPANHFGGRAGRTTTDAVLFLTQRVKDAWRKGHVATVLFLDITSAFPSVNHARLLHNLRKRQVPEDLVLWIQDFLSDRCTQVKFDDFTSEPLHASSGLPQGSPLSPILYLFYSADLLEVTDSKDPSKASGGFIDDTMLIVTSPTFEQNIAVLTDLVPQLLGWSKSHACRFDVAKFQMLHCTRNEKRYNPLPLVIDDHHILPSESARYLGIIVDRRLRWNEQADSAVDKGTSAVLAIARLSRPTYGLPHKHIRQLVRSVALPKMEYGLPVWYNPVRLPPGSTRRKGSVGLCNRLGKVQRFAARIISGAFKTTASVVLDFHASLLPIDLRLNQAAFNAAARLASLPPSHPLHKMVQLRDVEVVDPALVDPTWKCPFRTLIESSKDTAAALAEQLVSSGEFCVFTDGSGFAGDIGAAAFAKGRNQEHVRRVNLGSDNEHIVFEGELAGMVLALDVIESEPRVTRANILLDNKAAIRAVSKRRPRPGQQLVELFHRRLKHLKSKRRSLSLTVVWVPGHKGVAGNERADMEAKDASMNDETDLPPALQCLRHLPKSQSALKAAYKKKLSRDWTDRWKASKQGTRLARNVDPSPPGKQVLKLFKDLPRRQASILTQLRSGHVGLNAFLHRIKAVSSPLCSTCQSAETVQHYLLTCRRWLAQRDTLRRAVGRDLSLRSLLGTAKHRGALLAYIEATRRFEAYLNEPS